MKIAVIDHKPSKSSSCRRALSEKGLDLTHALTLEQFEAENGPIGTFDGVIIHPGLLGQAELLRQIPLRLEGKPIVVTSTGEVWDHGGREEKGIGFFYYQDTQKIYDYLTRRSV